MRARAFHIMDPKGIIEMLLIFLEERGDSVPFPPALDNTMVSFILNLIDQRTVRNFRVSIIVFLFFAFILFLSFMVIMVIIDFFYQLLGNTNRIVPYLGNWKGRSITKRSGVYGATIAEADTVSSLEMNDKGQLIQVS